VQIPAISISRWERRFRGAMPYCSFRSSFTSFLASFILTSRNFELIEAFFLLRARIVFSVIVNPTVVDIHATCPSRGLSTLTEFRAGAGLHWVTMLNDRLIQIEGDGNTIAGISTVVQIISVTVVVHVHVIVVVPIVCPVFGPRVHQTEPKSAVLEAAIPANIHHGEIVEAKRVILPIVLTKTVIRDAVAAVTAALLPRAVL
jgi:hypothetical protein